MHSESIVQTNPAHEGLLYGLHPFSQAGLRVNGQDLTNRNAWQPFVLQNKSTQTPLELSADTGDPQMDRDLVHLGKHTILKGGALWPGSPPPSTHFNMAANALRGVQGLPQEGLQVLPEDQIQRDAFPHLAHSSSWIVEPKEDIKEALSSLHEKTIDNGRVNREMSDLEKGTRQATIDPTSEGDTCPNCERYLQPGIGYEICPFCEHTLKTSKWSIVSLQEAPTGGGLDPSYNPVVDGPNPNGANFSDNAGNSPEQEIALQTWVNMALDALNRGESEDAVLAQLAHDGCPDPKAVIERALKQPFDENTGIAPDTQDPFEVPNAPEDEGSMQSVSQQPPVVTGSVRIKGTSHVGKEVERYEDMWGQGLVIVALEDGTRITVSPDQVENIADQVDSPLNDIQSFIDSFPPVEPHRASIMARIANLEELSGMCSEVMKTASALEQFELDHLSSEVKSEVLELRQALRTIDPDESDIYLAGLPTYRHNAFELASSTTDRIYEGNIREAAVIWASESPYTSESFEDDVRFSALNYCSDKNMNTNQVNEFYKAAKEKIDSKTVIEETISKVASNTDFPDEALFR